MGHVCRWRLCPGGEQKMGLCPCPQPQGGIPPGCPPLPPPPLQPTHHPVSMLYLQRQQQQGQGSVKGAVKVKPR